MAIELKQSLKLSQQLVMTPQLQQAIKLLQLNRLELAQHCQNELMENPILEEMNLRPEDEADDQSGIESTSTSNSDQVEAEVDPNSKQGAEDINWENYLNNHSKKPEERSQRIRGKDDLPSPGSNVSKTENLFESLMWQVHMSKFPESELSIARAIVGNINEKGYFDATIEDVSMQLGVTPEAVRSVLTVVQTFEPLGVGARDLKECLMIQAAHLPVSAQKKWILKIIENHLDEVERKKYDKISKAMYIQIPQVVACIETIRKLDPRPGRQFFDERSQYIIPDIYVNMVNGEPVIVQNDDGLPKLRLSSYYKSLLKNKNASEKEKEYINEKMRSALWLIRSIHQRQRTIYRVTQSIVRIQRAFLDEGVVALKPMVLKDVANDIGMHESTVSRVTTNKYIHTPQGIFELKYFFNSGIKSTYGGDMASEAVKSHIKKIIQAEDPKKPFSDQELVEILRQSNIEIARRTVAKYRVVLGILPSSKRRNIYH